VQFDYSDVTEVTLDRETRRLVIISGGRKVTLDGVDRLYVDDIPWGEAKGAVRLDHGHVSISGNVAAVTR